MLAGKYYTEGDTELLHTYINEKITNEKPLPCYIYANFGEGFNLLVPCIPESDWYIEAAENTRYANDV